MQEVTQRDLRDDSGRMMRALDSGESFIVTRNGVPVGQLSPLRRSQFITAETALAAYRAAPRADADRLRRDLDRIADQDPHLVAEQSRLTRGLLDTSVVIDLDVLDADVLPEHLAISAFTLAELAAAPHVTDDPAERARRQDRIQRTEAIFDPIPFDDDAARA